MKAADLINPETDEAMAAADAHIQQMAAAIRKRHQEQGRKPFGDGPRSLVSGIREYQISEIFADRRRP